MLDLTDAMRTMDIVPKGTTQMLSEAINVSPLANTTLQTLTKSTLDLTDAMRARPDTLEES